MSSSDNDIIITDSHDLDAGPMNSAVEVQMENEIASLQALEKQGISILNEMEEAMNPKPRDQFLQELMDNGGIEIVSSDDDEEL